MRMTRRHVLILAAAVALLLMTVDVHALFAARFLHDSWGWLRAQCDRLAEPLPMALVTVGAALLLTRDDARLPVVVNLAAALLLGTALEWLGAPHAPGGLMRLPRDAVQAAPSICFYGFLLWSVRQYCAAGALRAALTALLAAVLLAMAAPVLTGGPRLLPGVLAAAAVTGVYLWLLTGLARRRSAKAEA